MEDRPAERQTRRSEEGRGRPKPFQSPGSRPVASVLDRGGRTPETSRTDDEGEHPGRGRRAVGIGPSTKRMLQRRSSRFRIALAPKSFSPVSKLTSATADGLRPADEKSDHFVTARAFPASPLLQPDKSRGVPLYNKRRLRPTMRNASKTSVGFLTAPEQSNSVLPTAFGPLRLWTTANVSPSLDFP